MSRRSEDYAGKTQRNNLDGVAGPATGLEPAGTELPYVPRLAASGYFRYDDERRGTQASLDVTYTGRQQHFKVRDDFRQYAACDGVA